MKDFNRSDRVAEQLKRELSQLIRHESRDPRFQSFTVTAVRVSRDLSKSKVFLTSPEGEQESTEAVLAINKAANYFRYELKSRLLLRSIPQLEFLYDESVERGSRMTSLIEDTLAKDRARSTSSDEDETG